MKLFRWTRSRSQLCAAIGFLFVGIAAAGPVRAQGNAADLCTPDVMRLCQEFVPDADRIVRCLKSKRGQLSAECRGAMRRTTSVQATSYLSQHGAAKKPRWKRHRHRHRR